MLVLGFDDYKDQGQRLAKALSTPFEIVDIHRFPDGESQVLLPPELPEELIICRSLDRPNNKLIELLLTVDSAKEQGARHITLIAPYLCYMRQDKAFRKGEAVSQRIIGRFLAGLFDGVITTDAHLHRISQLGEAIPGIRAVNSSAAPIMSHFLRHRYDEIMLIGPDSESAQWVKVIAESAGYDFLVAQKQRLDDQHVRIALPAADYTGKKVVLVDDVISTGHTLTTIAGLLKNEGVSSIDALVTHALFDDSTAREMKKAGIENIWSTDSITHTSNCLHLAELLATSIKSH